MAIATTAIEGYDDIVSFGHVLADTVFYGSDEPVQALLGYFEKPHKWEREYQKWRALGGSLDKECVNQFENWHDSRCRRCGNSPDEGACFYCKAD